MLGFLTELDKRCWEGDEDIIACPVAVANLPDRCSPVGLCEIHGCTRETCYCRELPRAEGPLKGLRGERVANPWEDTELPEPETELYYCPGRGCRDIPFNYPSDMRWMKGEPGTDYPEDDYYCKSCVFRAKEHADEEERPEVVLGPKLSEELSRRQAL